MRVKTWGFDRSNYSEALGGETEFSSQTSKRSPEPLQRSNIVNTIDDWRELMRLYLVRRTRSFIMAELRRNRIRDGTEVSHLLRWNPFLLSHTDSQNGEVRNR